MTTTEEFDPAAEIEAASFDAARTIAVAAGLVADDRAPTAAPATAEPADTGTQIVQQIQGRIERALEPMAARHDEMRASLDAVSAEVREHAAQLAEQPAVALRSRGATIGDLISLGAPNPSAVGVEADDQFADFGEFVRAVTDLHRGHRHPGVVPMNSRAVEAALTGEEVEAGGALVPEQFRAQLYALDVMAGSIMGRVTTLPMGTSTLVMPTIRDTDRSGGTIYGGVRSYRIESGKAFTESAPEFGQIRLTATQLGTYTPVFNTMIADSAVTIPAMIGRMFMRSQTWTCDWEILNGDGAGEPRGILGHVATLAVPRASASSSGNTIGWEDIAAMENQLLPESAQDAEYWITPGLRGALIRILKETGDTAPDVSMAAPMRLLGRRVNISEHLPAPGRQGDILLMDPKFYLRGDRQTMSLAVSQHVEFLKNKTAFRMVSRDDGQPWLLDTLTLRSGLEVSPFVVLAP